MAPLKANSSAVTADSSSVRIFCFLDFALLFYFFFLVMVNITELPVEIVSKFFSEFTITEKINLQKVCKRFHFVLADLLLHQRRLSISKFGQSLAKGCNCCQPEHEVIHCDLIDLEELSLYNLYDCLKVIFTHCPSLHVLDLQKLIGIGNQTPLLQLIASTYGETLQCLTFYSFPDSPDHSTLRLFKSLRHLSIVDITGPQLLTLIECSRLEGLEATRYREGDSTESVLTKLPVGLKVLKIYATDACIENIFRSPACETLEVLDILNHNQQFQHHFKLPALKNLTFAGTVDVNIFIDSLSNSLRLEYLDLQSTYHTNFDSDLIIYSHLWKNFFQNVPKLQTILYPPSIFDDSIVTYMIHACPMLERIEHPCVRLTDQSLKSLSEASNLKVVDFGSSPLDATNDFTAEGVYNFLSKLSSNLLLLNLRSENAIITNEIEEIIESLTTDGKLNEVLLYEKSGERYRGIHLKRKT